MAATRKSATSSSAKKTSATSRKTAKRPAPSKETWTLDRTMKHLEKSGTAQNRKVYARHAVGSDQFGVSFKILGEVAKVIGKDHDLSQALWDTGNHDARMLAAKIGDPDGVTSAQLDRMARSATNHVVADALANLAAASPHAASRIKAWTGAKPTPANEYLIRAGYAAASANLTSRRKAKPAPDDLPDALLSDLLDRIQSTIHDMPNRAREGMNTCLIAIGAYRESLRKKALDVARKIGTVDIDHGETGCKTPHAASYIAKAVERNTRVPR